jgi:predicted MFS family arabinose efflux permease
MASGLTTVLCLGLTAFLVPAQAAARPTADADGKPTERPKSHLICLIAAYGLFGFGYVITATFISVIVRENPALNPAEPYVWLAVGLAAAPSVYLWIKVASLVGGPPTFSIACILEAGGVALSVVAETPAAVIAAAVFLGGTFMGITALGLMEARRLSPGAERQSLAVMTASFGLGQMVGPLLAGVLRQATGSFEIVSIFAAAALFLAAALVRH